MAKVCLTKKTFEPGENILEEGQEGEEAYLIKSGYVAIWKLQKGQRVNLAMRGDGEIVGEMALIDKTVRSATVTAETRVESEVITLEELEALLSEAPETLAVILHQLLESLRSANDLISMYASRPTSSS